LRKLSVFPSSLDCFLWSMTNERRFPVAVEDGKGGKGVMLCLDDILRTQVVKKQN
jgi:hypothetical protein